MRMKQMGLIAGVAFALGATLVGFTAIVDMRQQETVRTADIGGPFTLVGTDGQAVTEADLADRPTAIFFGFTFCPDVCPTTLHELTAMMEQLGDDADRMNFVFVSLDWERDGPDEMKSYVSVFDERIIGLTGDREQIDAVASAYGIHYERVPVEGGEYTIDHTASVILLDTDGDFAGMIDYHESLETSLAKLKRLTGSA